MLSLRQKTKICLMPKSKYMITIIALLVIAGLFLYYRSVAGSEVRDHVYGPFVIRMKKVSTKEYNMNYGWVKRQNISYSVWHKGKEVALPADLDSDTGFPQLWRVYILRDAPTPTILAGSQCLFVIKAKGDSYEVEALKIQSMDFIKFQWLDEVEGQPGPTFELYVANEQTPMDHPDTLAGGAYLLVDQKMVLHVPTMEVFSFNSDSNNIDNYVKDGEALAFSPNQRIISFPGYSQTWNTEGKSKYSYGLVSYDFRKNIKSVLSYSKNDTRLSSLENLNQLWFNTNFEWDTSGTEMHLKYKEREKPALWQGYFKEAGYHLYPVSDTMLIIFKQFVLDYMKWSSEAVIGEKKDENAGKVFQLGLGKSTFYLEGNKGKVSLMQDSFNANEDGTLQLIQDIGHAFDAVLMTGKNQVHFTAIPEEEMY